MRYITSYGFRCSLPQRASLHLWRWIPTHSSLHNFSAFPTFKGRIEFSVVTIRNKRNTALMYVYDYMAQISALPVLQIWDNARHSYSNEIPPSVYSFLFTASVRSNLTVFYEYMPFLLQLGILSYRMWVELPPTLFCAKHSSCFWFSQRIVHETFTCLNIDFCNKN